MSVHLTSSRRLVACGALALTLVLTSAACSDDDGGRVVADVLDDDGLATQPDVAATETTEPVAQVCEPEEPIEVATEDKPEVTSEGGDDPTELGIEDITVGEGHEVADGDSVQVQYTGVLFSDGTEFDTSWDDLTPLPVTVGSGGVIEGFDAGLVGMQPGGRRRLTIPAEQAYGDQAQGEDIPANSALVFVVDLVQVCFPDPEAAADDEPGEEGDETTTTLAEGEGEGDAGSGDESTTTVAEGEGGDEPTTTVAEGEDGSTETAPAGEDADAEG